VKSTNLQDIQDILVKFSQDLTYQKLLKSVNFLQSYSKNKNGRFVDTGYVPVIGTTCVYYVEQGLSVWCRLVVCSTGAAETRGGAQHGAQQQMRAEPRLQLA